jgi:drug/metabolite transporter (DMT)-like permease
MGLACVGCLVLLSLLWAAETLRGELLPNLMPDPLPHWLGLALPFALLAILSAFYAFMRRRQRPGTRETWTAIGIGAGMFVLPAVLMSLASAQVTGYTRTVLFTLVPVFAVVFEPYFGGSERKEISGGLVAALAAMAGALCIFPAQGPDSVEIGVGFCVVVLAAACVAAANCWAVRQAERISLAPLAAIASATAALSFAAMSAVLEHAEWRWPLHWTLHWTLLAPSLLWSGLVELPGLLLLFWLMARLSAVRMTTRYIVAPLLTILVGSVLLRSSLQWRTWAGLLLMSASAAYLLFAPEREPERTGLGLR